MRILNSAILALVTTLATPNIFYYASAESVEELPSWIPKSCCTPKDAHRLSMDAIYKGRSLSAEEAQDARPNWGGQTDPDHRYYVIDGYDYPIIDTYKDVRVGQDNNVWIFYREENGKQDAPPYCVFLPLMN